MNTNTLDPGGSAPRPAALRQRLGRPLRALLQRLGLTVSRDDVAWCYRHLLGREPESEAAVQAHSHFLRFRSLARAITESQEYRGRGRMSERSGFPADFVQRIDAQTFRREIDDWRREHPGRVGDDYVEMHFQRLLDTLNLMAPLLPPGGSVVDYSAMGYFTQATARLLGAGRQTNIVGVNFELEDHAERFGLGCHDLCLNTEVLEHLLFNPSRMVHNINRMLRPCGHLLLSTPNAVSLANAVRLMTGNPPSLWNQLNATSGQYFDRHNRDWTPFEVVKLLQAHGFEVLNVFTRDYYDDTRRLLSRHAALARSITDQSSHAHHGDTQFVVARKCSESVAPVLESWLYVLPATAQAAVEDKPT